MSDRPSLFLTDRTKERRALATAVRVLRAEAGISQERVDANGGLGQHTTQNVERRRRSPQFESLLGIAEGLGISMVELMTEYERQLSKLRARPE